MLIILPFKSMTLFKQIYQITKQIPRGKVTTYGTIAQSINLKDSRLVGWALHQNKDYQIPCHRVVNRQGKLAPGYVLGGIQKQKQKLKKEGIKFLNKNTVDLESHFWKP